MSKYHRCHQYNHPNSDRGHGCLPRCCYDGHDSDGDDEEGDLERVMLAVVATVLVLVIASLWPSSTRLLLLQLVIVWIVL